MINIDSDDLNEEQQYFVEEPVRASVCDIVCSEEFEPMIEKGIIKEK